MVAVVAVFLVGVATWLPLGLGIVDSPLIQGSWPRDVSPAALRQAALDGLRSCARSQDSSPAGCPQSTAAAGSVSWVLAGDPLAGAGVAMTGRSGAGRAFQVWGTYAMVATGITPVTASEGPYIAAVTWDGRSLHVDAIRRGRFDTGQPRGLEVNGARRTARAAFERCHATPGPVLCPTVGAGSIPLATPDTSRAAVFYDRATGVTHVRGAFSSGGVDGTYDAHETIGPDGSPTCYLITYSVR